MNETFRNHVDALHPSFERLIAMRLVTARDLPSDVPAKGIYLFSENDIPLYVGRTNVMRSRLKQHCRLGARHNSAAFAFLLAREATNNLHASYKAEGLRANLAAQPEFAAAFTAAKLRLGLMELRFVEEENPMRQALLEMYAALSLETPYNSFDNH